MVVTTESVSRCSYGSKSAVVIVVMFYVYTCHNYMPQNLS